jgi:hypothetical protein
MPDPEELDGITRLDSMHRPQGCQTPNHRFLRPRLLTAAQRHATLAVTRAYAWTAISTFLSDDRQLALNHVS